MNNNENPYAVEDLAEFMRLAKKAEKSFIFITGAGCSVTAGIPLAQKIVSEINEKFPLELKPLSDEDRKDYGKRMGRLEISKRREYLQKYISKAKINWAHIALACLMKAGYVRRVMTFNFDNLLARSCGLLGQYPPTYDFTAANLNLHRLIDDPAIVHLHGQGHGFVQLNTEFETKEHAERLKEFVGHILSESPTLFIGYSGSNDAFLPQIEEQFSDQHRLFWVDMGDEAPEHLKHKLLTSSLAHYMSCENGADLFLIELARELGCFPPTIFVDPYQHLLDELDEIASFPISKDGLLEDKESVIARLSDIAQDILLETKNKLKEVQQRDKNGDTDFLQEYLQGDYHKIIKVLEVKNSLNHDQSLWLARSYFELALKEPSRLKQIEIYEKLINKFKESMEIDIQEYVGLSLVNKAVLLGELKQPENEIKIYDDIIARFSDSNELVLQEQTARSLNYKAIALSELGQSENEIEVCDEIVARFGDSNEFILQRQVAMALNAIGYSKLIEAKKQWKNFDIAQNHLHEALESFSKAVEKSSEIDHSIILGNIAYTEFLQGNFPESEKYLREALKQGKQSLYDDTVKDIGKYPIDPDTNFEKLLEKLWHEINKQT